MRDDKKLDYWVKVIARNKVKKLYQKRNKESKRKFSFNTLEVEIAAEDSAIPDELIYKDLDLFTNSEVYNLVLKLGKPASTIIILHYVYKENFTEIADTLKMNPNTVRSIAMRSRERLKRMVEEGHIVGNHTYHHPDMSKIGDMASFQQEIGAVEEKFRQITGQDMPKYYRPPQGKFNESNLKMAQELGYQTIFWSLAYVDWYTDKQPTQEEAYQKLLPRIHPGAIVLLHVTSQTNGEIMDELLTKWEEQGYTFGTLDQLTAQGN